MTRSNSSLIAIAGPILVGAVLAGASPAAAEAPCTQWDVSGNWLAQQTNGVAEIRVQRQIGQELQGQATVPGEVKLGPLDGIVEGNRISFTVYWDARSVSVYSGAIGSAGRVEGITRDTVSGATATWFSNRRMNCLARGAAAPPPPAKSLGKKKKISPNAPESLKEKGGLADAFKTSPVLDPLLRQCKTPRPSTMMWICMTR